MLAIRLISFDNVYPMPEVNREYLIIPNDDELAIAFDSMKDRVGRKIQPGGTAEDFDEIAYPNAIRILGQNSALREHLERLSRQMATGVAETLNLGIDEVYMHAIKGLLETMSVATTYSQVSEISVIED